MLSGAPGAAQTPRITDFRPLKQFVNSIGLQNLRCAKGYRGPDPRAPDDPLGGQALPASRALKLPAARYAILGLSFVLL